MQHQESIANLLTNLLIPKTKDTFFAAPIEAPIEVVNEVINDFVQYNGTVTISGLRW